VRKHRNKEIDASQLAVPEQVSVALAELVGEVREGLLALAVPGFRSCLDPLVRGFGV